MWPRVIVDIAPDNAATSDVKVAALLPDGTLQDGARFGCPSGFSSLVCSYTFFASPTLTSLTLQVSRGGDVRLLVPVTLVDFNYCGKDAVFVVVSVDSMGNLSATVPSYVSPCDKI